MATLFNWYGGDNPLGVLSVVHEYLNLRVYFTAPVINNAALVDPKNYQIYAVESSYDYDFRGLQVTPENTLYPTYVDIETTDCVGGENYELVVAPYEITGYDSSVLEGNLNTAKFVGVTEYPTVLAAIPTSQSSVRVVFSKYMTRNSHLYNPSMYVWSHGLKTLNVEEETDSTVILTTSEQTSTTVYELTVG